MKWFPRLMKVLKSVKLQEAEAKTARMLTDDPISVELIAKIAREYQYHFEIVQKDGTILRFTKEGVTLGGDPNTKDVW
jgi:hypothetical protein